MSVPIVYCRIVKAAKGDEAVYAALIEDMKYNLWCGHYSTFGCRCEPKCEATTEELEAIGKRMEQYFKDNPVKCRYAKLGEGESPPPMPERTPKTV